MFTFLGCPIAVAVLIALLIAGARNRRQGVRAPRSTVFAAVALGSLCVAILAYDAGTLSLFRFEVDELCSSYEGAGSFVGYRESSFPISGKLTCSERTVQLVPFWVNPLVFLSSAAASAFAVAAVVAWRRRI
ncbi:hypothetical protein [Glycomyces sp. NRRL B-16210]|uniref:hypothetical protein n=1 Tax=Glycomyces sp. NRRL B-16210 TaxID=1463821 RepID=UPI0004BFF51F|nr:hypothetical protein [Glycomyces sp. NRRL B-16210]